MVAGSGSGGASWGRLVLCPASTETYPSAAPSPIRLCELGHLRRLPRGDCQIHRLTGMGRSLYRPLPENQVEDSRLTIHFTTGRRIAITRCSNATASGTSTAINRVRRQADQHRRETNRLCDGFGQSRPEYLNRTAQGTLVELPVSWYAEKGGYWAMSPGYDRANQEDFRRTIISECLFCHTSYPAPEQGFNLTTNQPVFGDDIPEGIDCQRCHGPGRAHIEAAGSCTYRHGSRERPGAALTAGAAGARSRRRFIQSGVPPLDEWLKRHARRNELEGASRTFVILRQESVWWGISALRLDLVPPSPSLARVRRNTPYWVFGKTICRPAPRSTGIGRTKEIWQRSAGRRGLRRRLAAAQPSACQRSSSMRFRKMQRHSTRSGASTPRRSIR